MPQTMHASQSGSSSSLECHLEGTLWSRRWFGCGFCVTCFRVFWCCPLFSPPSHPCRGRLVWQSCIVCNLCIVEL